VALKQRLARHSKPCENCSSKNLIIEFNQHYRTLAAVLPVTQVATLGPQGMTEQFITYFGYGSLVNRDTRPLDEQAHPARLLGWQRVWGHRVNSSDLALQTSRQSCCSLSIDLLATSTSAYIDGVVVTIPLADLPILDKREAGYERLALPASDFQLPADCTAAHIHVYKSDTSHEGRSDAQFPILQSYIDCVLAGYCAVFGQDGMQQFVTSTAGWDGVIENDRVKPRYPRAVTLPASQLSLFDRVVNRHRS